MGELLGHLRKAEDVLKTAADLTEQELQTFSIKAVKLAMLIPKLNTFHDVVAATPDLPQAEANKVESHRPEEAEPADAEHLRWGPKTADPGPDRIYPSMKL